MSNVILPPVTPTANISKVAIKRLFGLYNYILENKNTHGDHNLLILYGDNGCGKSTTLKLIYHLLNPEPYNGHRTYVGSVPFEKISIYLDTGSIVSAYRSDPQDLSHYTLQLHNPSFTEDPKWTWNKDDRGIKSDKKYLHFCNLLNQEGLKLHFLQDSRQTERLDHDIKRRLSRIEQDQILFSLDERNEDQTLAQRAIHDTLQWFQREALSGTTQGQTSANELYSTLIETLISAKDHKDPATKLENIQNSIAALENLEKENRNYSRYGLTAELNTTSIRKHLETAPEAKINILTTVIQPYLAGHTARLNALLGLQETIETFVSLLTEFYKSKKVSLTIGKSFSITTENGVPLDAEHLSSGEKHLLLLFCNAILARSEGTVLIIDEPEISLNIKWQRKLIEALQACLKGVKHQLIIATHSFEILAQHDDYVATFNHIPNEQFGSKKNDN